MTGERSIPRVLLIGSEEPTVRRAREEVQAALDGCIVRSCGSREEGRTLVGSFHPDVVLLLTDKACSGGAVEFARWLRAEPAHGDPLLMLACRATQAPTWGAFYAAGGDLWVPWTRGFAEQLPHGVRALLQRRWRMGSATARAGLLELFEESLTARIGQVHARFTPLQFRVLAHLVRNQGRLVAPSELAGVLHAASGAHAEDAKARSALYEVLSQVRRRLRPHQRIIRTVRGAGYRLDPHYEVPPTS